jgi:DNA-directed RNA polymerase subunit M/transcription elongation factor TFIIS
MIVTLNESQLHKLIIESINEALSNNIDFSTIGEVDYEWDFDEDDYNDYLTDNNLQSNTNTLLQYIKEDNVSFYIEYSDNETYHRCDAESLYYSELLERFGDKFTNEIIDNCIKCNKGSFETYRMFENDEYDINNPEQLNNQAKKQLPHGGYYKDCRGFILTDGTIIYTPNEHRNILMIDGIQSVEHFVKLGNIRIIKDMIDIKSIPTYEQKQVLSQMIRQYSDSTIYLDMYNYKTDKVGLKYNNPDYRKVLADIDRYFIDNIKPLER